MSTSATNTPCDTPPLPGEVEATRLLIRNALAEDARCRHPGVTAGLYGLESLAPFSRLGHGLPVIRNREAPPFSRAATNEEFRSRLRRVAPYLATFDFRLHGLRLAGGAASALLMRDAVMRGRDGNPVDQVDRNYHDFDLFLVGHVSDQSAKDAIYAFAAHMAAGLTSEDPNRPTRGLEVYRTQNCISFYGGRDFDMADLRAPESTDSSSSSRHTCDPFGRTNAAFETSEYHSHLVQIILRQYSTDGEVIHGFDMGSSAMLWDGHRVLVTGLGKLAAERGVNVLNLVARRGSYERRLAKYFARGFDLVLPDLDGCALTAAHDRLPYLYVVRRGKGSCACDIPASALRATRPGHDNWGYKDRSADDEGPAEEPEPAERPASDYSWGDVRYGSPHGVLMRNIQAVSGETVRVASLCAQAKYSDRIRLFDIEPEITEAAMRNIAEWAFHRPDGAVSLGTLRRLLGPDRAASLVLDFMAKGKRPSSATLAAHCAARLAQLPAPSIPFAFMRVEDKTALTGPFPREVVTVPEWYGDADRSRGT